MYEGLHKNYKQRIAELISENSNKCIICGIAEIISEKKIKCIKCGLDPFCFIQREHYMEAYCRECESCLDKDAKKHYICSYCDLVAENKVYTRLSQTDFVCDECTKYVSECDYYFECAFPFYIVNTDSIIPCPKKRCKVCRKFWKHCYLKEHIVPLFLFHNKPDFCNKEKTICGLDAAVDNYLLDGRNRVR